VKSNRIYLLADIIWNEKWQVILLAILLCVVTTANCTSYSQYKKYSYFRELLPYMKNAYFSSDFEQLQQNRYASVEREDLLNIYENDVYNILFVSYGLDLLGFINGDEYSGDLMQIYSYPIDFSSNRILPIKTVDGKIITELKPNEILLDESLIKAYSVGDVITLNSYGVYGYGIDKNVEKNILYQIRVAGFVSLSDYIVSDAGGNKINSIYSPVDNNITYVNDGNVSRGIISYLDNGKYIYCDGMFQNTVSGAILFVNDGYTLDDLRNELSEDGFDDISLISYNYLLEKYEHDYADEIRTSRIMLLVSAILTIAVIASSFFSNYIRKRKELAIYNLLGSTWSESIIMSLSPYILSIVFGTLFGWSYWYYHTYFEARDVGISVPIYLFIVLFSIYLVLYSLMGLVYYLCFKRLKPVEQYRVRE